MSEYGVLARYYDRLTGDVDYPAFANYYEAQFRENGLKVKTALDLACGTGTLTALLAARGYEMIGADQSADMLTEARSKPVPEGAVPPLWLNQSMETLDLYGTVDAELCSLDGMNYASPENLPEIFHRLWLFLEPGGILIFDVLTPAHLMSLDGQTFVDETEDVFCVWRSEFDRAKNACRYGMDLFSQTGNGLWRRDFEEHIEYAHPLDALGDKLAAAGFSDVRFFGDKSLRKPGEREDRVFITARKPLSGKESV